MDCRKFHQNLEDYLEDGLDFPGRFAMERHVQQCIRCGKELAVAQRLRRMVREMDRVKAPSNFELSVLNEIGKLKTDGRFSRLKRFWVYGFELPSIRKLALASSCLAILAFGIFYFSADKSGPKAPKPASIPSALAVQQPARVDQTPVPAPAPAKIAVVRPRSPLSRGGSKPEELTKPPDPEREKIVEEELAETDYVELQVIGPDNRPVPVYRQPNKPRFRDGQSDEDSYFRNVSH
jgi:hypothetical protein